MLPDRPSVIIDCDAAIQSRWRVGYLRPTRLPVGASYWTRSRRRVASRSLVTMSHIGSWMLLQSVRPVLYRGGRGSWGVGHRRRGRHHGRHKSPATTRHSQQESIPDSEAQVQPVPAAAGRAPRVRPGPRSLLPLRSVTPSPAPAPFIPTYNPRAMETALTHPSICRAAPASELTFARSERAVAVQPGFTLVTPHPHAAPASPTSQVPEHRARCRRSAGFHTRHAPPENCPHAALASPTSQVPERRARSALMPAIARLAAAAGRRTASTARAWWRRLPD